MATFHLLKIRTSIDIFKNEKCKVTFGLEYMYLTLAGFPVRHIGSNDPVPKKVQSGVRSRQ